MEPELIQQAKADLVEWLRRKRDAPRQPLTVGDYLPETTRNNIKTTASKCRYLKTTAENSATKS